MAAWSPSTALLRMSSPLGGDQLIPISLVANEQISQPFTFDVHAICQLGVINTDDLLYQPCCVTLQSNGVPIRYFHGIVQTISAEGEVRGQGVGEQQMYHIMLVPRLWFHAQTTDCRVYQKLTTVGILEKLCDEVNLTDRQFPPPGSEREYTVQFNESDLHFITRLLEEEGYFYFFEHSAGSHKLIVSKQNGAFTDIPGRDNASLGRRERSDLAHGLVAADQHGARQDEVQGLRPGKARYAAAGRASHHAQGRRRDAARRLPLAGAELRKRHDLGAVGS